MTLSTGRPELFRAPLDIPEVPYDHLLRKVAEGTPERPAIVYQDFILTYREVVSIVNSLANGLHILGISKGDRIEFIDALPRVPSGKILRRALKEREKSAIKN